MVHIRCQVEQKHVMKPRGTVVGAGDSTIIGGRIKKQNMYGSKILQRSCEYMYMPCMWDVYVAGEYIYPAAG